jgi:hypothetical protein
MVRSPPRSPSKKAAVRLVEKMELHGKADDMTESSVSESLWHDDSSRCSSETSIKEVPSTPRSMRSRRMNSFRRSGHCNSMSGPRGVNHREGLGEIFSWNMNAEDEAETLPNPPSNLNRLLISDRQPQKQQGGTATIASVNRKSRAPARTFSHSIGSLSHVEGVQLEDPTRENSRKGTTGTGECVLETFDPFSRSDDEEEPVCGTRRKMLRREKSSMRALQKSSSKPELMPSILVAGCYANDQSEPTWSKFG